MTAWLTVFVKHMLGYLIVSFCMLCRLTFRVEDNGIGGNDPREGFTQGRGVVQVNARNFALSG